MTFWSLRKMQTKKNCGKVPRYRWRYLSKTNTIETAWWYLIKTQKMIWQKQREATGELPLEPKSGWETRFRSTFLTMLSYEYDWGNGTSDLRTIYPDPVLKAKTFMVLGEIIRRVGTMRRHTSPMPMAAWDDTSYYPWGYTGVLGHKRALKMNRTKAVKDAKDIKCPWLFYLYHDTLLSPRRWDMANLYWRKNKLPRGSYR